ncbi:DUF6101 family protein [Bradyrhizobium sp. LHD-71]|uniref:DUF6101 family protein n=1 Tax=Bradyrhizobium sp. LHD-71 TaxID=3072141 RepID=UPI00280D2410|nr:DUF6101 family protein [Bradyrhizobium sp. LHD-71]MDQ8726802.1 DUF6101 family protein [Bradyrhizobium sp. LHD-71]
MRRQTTTGVNPAGSSRIARLDPLSLPASFEARDTRADGGVRRVEIRRDRVTVRRAVRGMSMAISIRISEFLGVALRTIEGAPTLILKHRDPSLSVPLATGHDNMENDWQTWSETLALPQLAGGEDQSAGEAAPRRRRRNVIKARRPSILMRRKGGGDVDTMKVHHGEREIIARD